MDVIRIEIPADGSHVIIPRLAIATVAERAGMPLSRQDDAKLAIDETAAMLLADAEPGSPLTIELAQQGDSLAVRVVGATTGGRVPRADLLGWTILGAVADRVETRQGHGHQVTVSFDLHPLRPHSS